jgi:hypothetical protein
LCLLVLLSVLWMVLLLSNFHHRRVGTRPDLLATCGDQLRIWNISDNAVVLDRLLSNVSNSCMGLFWWQAKLQACTTFCSILDNAVVLDRLLSM